MTERRVDIYLARFDFVPVKLFWFFFIYFLLRTTATYLQLAKYNRLAYSLEDIDGWVSGANYSVLIAQSPLRLVGSPNRKDVTDIILE